MTYAYPKHTEPYQNETQLRIQRSAARDYSIGIGIVAVLRYSAHMSEALINIAVILGAFGVKGEVKLKSLTENPKDFLNFGPLLDADGQRVLTVQSVRPVKGGFAALCDEVDTPEQAKAMNGIKLYGPKALLPEPEEDEFYYSDLVGLSVKTDSGKNMGTVIGVYDFGAGDILEIKPTAKAEKQASWYHPFTKRDVPKIDMKARRIIIVLPEVLNAKDPVKGEED